MEKRKQRENNNNKTKKIRPANSDRRYRCLKIQKSERVSVTAEGMGKRRKANERKEEKHLKRFTIRLRDLGLPRAVRLEGFSSARDVRCSTESHCQATRH